MLRQFQGGLNQLASKMVHTGSTSKYSSINVQSNRVEFRSPGGDWMGEYASDPGKVKNTLLRGVVALGVATDPTAYKQEYYKKLYKTLSQGREDSSIEYFAKYAAGELPKQALKSFIKQLQTKRQVGKDAGSGKLYWWRVFRQGYSGSIEVVAATREEAIDKGTASDGYPSWRGQPDVRAEPVRPYTAEQTPSRDQEFTGTWEVVSRNSNEVVHTIRGIGNAVADAERHAATWQEQTGFDDPVYVRPQMRPRQQQQQPQTGGEQSSDANYEILDKSTEPWTVKFRFIANTPQEAMRKLSDWVRGTGEYGPNNNTWISRYGVRPIEGRPTAEPVPGSTEYLNRELAAQEPAGCAGQQTYRVTYTVMDDQGTSMHDTSVQARNADAAMAQVRQALQARGQTPEYISADPLISAPARGTESLPPGNVRWLVLDRNDQEVYSFINTTNQGDANQYARQWMTTTAPREVRDRGPFTIVPAR
jgi:hypothetical protein